MPNWIAHKLTCTSKNQVLTQMCDDITGTSYDCKTGLNFHHIIPIPDLVLGGDFARVAMMQEKINRNIHEWCIRHWGTRSNAYYRREPKWDNDQTLLFYFDTPRVSPMPVLTELSWLYPEVIFKVACINDGDVQRAHLFTLHCGESLEERCLERKVDPLKFDQLYEDIYRPSLKQK